MMCEHYFHIFAIVKCEGLYTATTYGIVACFVSETKKN